MYPLFVRTLKHVQMYVFIAKIFRRLILILEKLPSKKYLSVKCIIIDQKSYLLLLFTKTNYDSIFLKPLTFLQFIQLLVDISSDKIKLLRVHRVLHNVGTFKYVSKY